MAKPILVLAAACVGLQLGTSQVVFAQGLSLAAHYHHQSIPSGGTSGIVTRPLAAVMISKVKCIGG